MTALAVSEIGTAENPTMITGTTTISTGGVYQLADEVGAAAIITINKDLSVTIIGAADGTEKDVAIVANANVNLTIQNLQIRPKNNTAIKFNSGGVLQIVGTNSLAGGINGDTDCGAVNIVAGEVKLQAASGSETASASLTTTTTNYAAGIRVKSGATLTIESGIWTVTSNSSGAAIGGTGHFAKEAEAFGTIKITGGQVNAESTGRGAAIGAGGANSTGSGGKTGTIEITGGAVTAAALNGAAIGSGVNVSDSVTADLSITTTISGGTVTANGKVQGAVTVKGSGALALNNSVSYSMADKTAVTLEGGTLTIPEGIAISGNYSVSMTNGTINTGNDFTLKGESASLTGTLAAGGKLTASTASVSTYTLSGTMTDTTLTSGVLNVDKDSTLNGNTSIKSGATLTLQAEASAAAILSGTADVENGASITGTGFVTGTLDVKNATITNLKALYTVGSGASVIGLSGNNKVQQGGNKATLTFTGYAERPFTLTMGVVDYTGTTGADGTVEVYMLAAANANIILKTDENVRYSGTATITGNNKSDNTQNNIIDVSDLTVMAPEVSSVTPANSASDVATSTKNIVLAFDQEVTAKTLQSVQMQERTSSTATSYNTYTCVVQDSYVHTDTASHTTTVTLPIKAFSSGSNNLGLSAGRHYTVVLNAGSFTGKVDNATANASYSFSTAAGKSVVVQLTSGGTIRGTVFGSDQTITAAGTYSVADGSSISFTAKPNSGYKLDKVEVTRGASTTQAEINNDGVSFTVSSITDGTTTVKVYFIADTGAGSVTLDEETKQGVTVEVGAAKSAYFTTSPLDLSLTAISSDTSVATVGGVTTSGQRRYVNVTGVSAGSATIYILKPDGSAAAFSVTVVAKANEAPALITGAATNITKTGATLNGSMTANGNTILEAGFRIMTYGGGYLMQAGTYDEDTGSVTAAVSTLSPGTTYYYHIYVKTAGGTFYGNTSGSIDNDVSFKTSAQSSGGGGGGSSSSSQPTISVGANGTVKLSGSTLTITPDEGYQVADVTVNGKSQGAVEKVTGLKSSDQVVVTFEKVSEQPSIGFVDVPADAYYADAVAWAVENGVTAGTSANTFSPDASCTRAQMVTFLWRVAGYPAPKAESNPFSDLNPSAYYYDAVLWAVENGITVGTSATTFSPDAVLTRGQTVTFLYRAAGSPAASGNSFADVPADAYYANAVAWAVSKGVTVGTGATTFSPDADCTRGQIVTFLWRDHA